MTSRRGHACRNIAAFRRASKRRSLLLAGKRQKELLAFVDAVGVGNFRVGLRDAAPRGDAAILCLCNSGKRVAPLNGDLQIGFQARDCGGGDAFMARGGGGGGEESG